MKYECIQSEIIADSKNSVTLLQFLNNVQNSKIEYIDQIFYRVAVFRLQDFIQLQNESNNHQYQLVKVEYLLKELQTGILLTSLNNVHFQSLVVVALAKFTKV